MNPLNSKVKDAIRKEGKVVTTRDDFLKHNGDAHGKVSLIPSEKMIAAKLTKPNQKKSKSTVTQVGKAPEGFGKVVNWDEEDESLAVLAFLSAADPYGLMISGVKASDTIEFPFAGGIASFSEDTENEGVAAFIGVIAAGATATAAAFGAPEIAPVIGAAEEFAKSQFKEQQVKTKRRDPFGEDPGTGHKAKQEGGVIVCLPRSGRTTQVFYSRNDDHKERWIKEPGTRDTAHLPEHISSDAAFFLFNQGGNIRKVTADGDIIIAPWDHIFEDNFGFYRLHILLKRGKGNGPVIE